MIKFYDVDVRTATCVEKVTDNGIQARDRDGNLEEIPANTVIIAVGYLPELELYKKIKDRNEKIHVIGDASKVRNIMSAIWDGYEVGRTL